MVKYIISPFFKEKENATIKEKVVFLIQTYLYYFIGLIIAVIIINWIDFIIVHYLGLPSINKLVTECNQNVKKNFGTKYFLSVIIITPFLEELIFRLPLNLRKSSFGISIAVLIYRFSGNGILKSNFYDYHDWLRLLLAISSFFIIYMYMPQEILTKIKENYFKHFFYIIATLFALVHISNFAIPDYRLYLFYPIYVLPQFVMGLFIGNIRMKYGFIWGWVLHGLINLPSVFF